MTPKNETDLRCADKQLGILDFGVTSVMLELGITSVSNQDELSMRDEFFILWNLILTPTLFGNLRR
jgi:hypothetical protein